MKARVEIFQATHIVGENPEDFATSPACPTSWCRWVLADSVAFAYRSVPRAARVAGTRAPLTLPALPEVRAAPDSSSSGSLTRAQRERIAAQKENAQRRKVQRAALPALPAVTAATGSSSSGSLTAEQRKKVAEKRENAKRRKLQQVEAEDDPFGHGSGIG